MPQPIGYNFAPTFENAETGRRGQPADQAQRAIQTLSFQLPKFAGAGRTGVSPLQGQPFAGSPISQAVLQSVLRTILGPDAVMGAFADPNASSDPAGVHGSSEVSPSMFPMPTGPSRSPTIHIGDSGPRLPLGPPFMSGGASGEIPPFGMSSWDGSETSPYRSWMDQERALGRQPLHYLSPEFGGSRMY